MSKGPFSVLFAGTPSFAVPSLLALANDAGFRVELVITQPDKPVGRKKAVTPSPVKVTAQKLGIPVWQPGDINKEWTVGSTQWTTPDFLVVVAYGQILKREILVAPKIAAINVHASLLPRWRGASPIHHAILGGDATTGITVQRMAEKLDTGPVLRQMATSIEARETFPELHDRLAVMGAELLVETLKSPLRETPQDERAATICRKLSRKTGDVDPLTMTAEEIDRKVRALNPWPGVRCAVDGTIVKLLRTSLTERPESVPLGCRESVLHLLEVQPEGRTAMTATEWMRGKR